jgi:hypothetical protein
MSTPTALTGALASETRKTLGDDDARTELTECGCRSRR